MTDSDIPKETTGLPDSATELLIRLNQPSATRLRFTLGTLGGLIDAIPVEEWQRESQLHACAYMAMLLQHPELALDDFEEVFAPLNAEYQAMLLRAGWVRANSRERCLPLTVMPKLLARLDTVLGQLRLRFSLWIVTHPDELQRALRRIALAAEADPQ